MTLLVGNSSIPLTSRGDARACNTRCAQRPLAQHASDVMVTADAHRRSCGLTTRFHTGHSGAYDCVMVPLASRMSDPWSLNCTGSEPSEPRTTERLLSAGHTGTGTPRFAQIVPRIGTGGRKTVIMRCVIIDRSFRPRWLQNVTEHPNLPESGRQDSTPIPVVGTKSCSRGVTFAQ